MNSGTGVSPVSPKGWLFIVSKTILKAAPVNKNPKSEDRKKSEIRSANRLPPYQSDLLFAPGWGECQSPALPAVFGFRASGLLRISAFGFILRCPSPITNVEEPNDFCFRNARARRPCHLATSRRGPASGRSATPARPARQITQSRPQNSIPNAALAPGREKS